MNLKGVRAKTAEIIRTEELWMAMNILAILEEV
jgi:hypothetical protein